MKFIFNKRSCDFTAVKFFYCVKKLLLLLRIAITCPKGANFTLFTKLNLPLGKLIFALWAKLHSIYNLFLNTLFKFPQIPMYFFVTSYSLRLPVVKLLAKTRTAGWIEESSASPIE